MSVPAGAGPGAAASETFRAGFGTAPDGGRVTFPAWHRRLAWYWPAAVALCAAAIVMVAIPTVTEASRLPPVNVALLGTSLAYKHGVARSGVACGPGVRQVKWSKYAPGCVPVWPRGKYNGGATWSGVTSTTITVTYREPNAAGAGVMASLFAPDLGTNAQAIETMQDYVKVFNRNFELYGRHVVLRPFTGKGDFLNELQGQGLETAEADALEAQSFGAFADVSLLSSTQPYDQYLAAEKIVAIGAIAQPQWWYDSFAPYEYSQVQNCDSGVQALAIAMGHVMAGLPAIFAGDPVIARTPRKFGLIFPENPTYASCGNELVRLAGSEYGIHFARVIEYAMNASEESSEAMSAIAQMKARGVTTIMCGCDPVFPLFLTVDANGQQYYPEWMTLHYPFDFVDQMVAGISPREWAKAISSGTLLPPKAQQEAYKVYLLSGDKAAPSPQFASIYEPLLLLFDALQAAGPDLNPATFQAGYFRLPASEPGGDYGAWRFGPDRYVPIADSGPIHWDPNVTSPEDGKAGTWVACNGGKRYPLSAAGAGQLPDHRQLDCTWAKPKVVW